MNDLELRIGGGHRVHHLTRVIDGAVVDRDHFQFRVVLLQARLDATADAFAFIFRRTMMVTEGAVILGGMGAGGRLSSNILRRPEKLKMT